MNMAIPIRVLILEDNPSDAELMVDALKRAGLESKWERVESERDFTARLTPELDLILSDYTLPQFDGLRALRLVRSRGLDVPFILVSGSIGEDIAVDAMRNGADDYLLKDRMARLGQAAIHAIDKKRIRDERRHAESALAETGERLNAIVETAVEGIITIDERGRVESINPEAVRIFGYTLEELRGQNVNRLMPAPHADRHDGYLDNYLRTGDRKIIGIGREFTGRRKDGSVFPMDLSVTEVHVGGKRKFAGFVRDITVRKLQEQRIEKLLRVREVSSGINAAIVRSRNRQELLGEACRIAVEYGNFGIAWAGVYDPNAKTVTPAAWGGKDDPQHIRHFVADVRDEHSLGTGELIRAIREKTPIFSNDISADPDAGGMRRQEAVRLGYRSHIVLPLMMEGQVAATLALFTREPGYFTDDELKLLTELAGNISLALEHMARQEKLEKLSRIRAVSSEINAAIVRTRERSALLKEICRIASEQGKFEMVWIGTIDHEKREVRPVAWAGFSAEAAHAVSWASIGAANGTLGEAIRTRKPAIRNDLEAELPAGKLRQEALQHGCFSTICVPMEMESDVVALLALFATGRGFFDQGELLHLGEVASNISFALESIARQGRIERLSRIRAVLGEINAAIVRTRGRQELFDEACRIVVDAGGFPFAWIGVVDKDAKQIRPIAWAGEEERYFDTMQRGRSLDGTLTPQGGPAVRAVREKKAVVANDIRNDPRIARKQEHLERNVNSLAVLPLLGPDEAVGVLALHARETGFFDEEEMKLLSELAGDIAFALQTIGKQEKLDYLSYYDPLTGLPNRALFIDRAGQQMRARSGEPRMVALILLNLERFRNTNETLGRHGGDALLKLVAQRLESAFNGKDYLARIGADVFGIVIRGIRDASAVVHAVESQVLGCFREPFNVVGRELRVAAKAGIAMHPDDGADADTLFSNAEAALKKARDSGEHYLFYAADMNARAAQMLSLETRLRKAVEARQFVLHYQPKIDLSRNAICGLEALIRWNDPESGLAAPGTFIPLLEETGLILEVGKWALAQALTDHREWTARGCAVPRVAVNVSAIQLQQKDFTEMVIGAVRQGAANPEALELEITESLLIKDVESSIRKLSNLRELGIHIAMDDFGTGYSSLSYIARLPLTSVKIDRSFINGMANSPQDMAIVTTIIALAHSLNLRAVAEGVETGEQLQVLKLLKCDEAQGFLFCKPLPAAEIAPLLRTLPGEPNEPAADPVFDTVHGTRARMT